MGAKWFWGIILLALLSLLYTCVGPYKQYSVDMGDSIRDALAAENIGVNVEMDGHVAKLTGDVPSDAVAQRAVAIAEGTTCKTCKEGNEKIWHKVENNLNVPEVTLPVQSPYRFSAVKTDDGVVTLDGYVPSDDVRRNILADANSRFDTVIDSQIRLASGQPSDHWPAVISSKLADLSSLDNGKLLVEDYQVLLTGKTGDASLREAINGSIVNLPEGYNGAANILVPDLGVAQVGKVDSQSVCQELFNSLKGNNKVNFASGKAELRGAATFDLLNNLASAAEQCETFRVLVDGHTDSEGAEEYNQWLSESRANSVVEYLTGQGVSADRIEARGYGELKPITSNDTREGMARNRRIEFIVTQSN